MKKFLVGMIGIGVAVGLFTVKSALYAGETEGLAKPAAHDAKPMAIGECLSTCKDTGCLRNCIANGLAEEFPP